MEAITNLCTTVVGKVLLAIVVWFVGKFIVNKLLGLVGKIKALDKIEPNTRTFVLSALKWLLYVILVVSIVAILGVPMASVITVLGTAGAAIALSLQGSLSNLAGGIMLVIFRPFKVGDFVEASGVTGTVRSLGCYRHGKGNHALLYGPEHGGQLQNQCPERRTDECQRDRLFRGGNPPR